MNAIFPVSLNNGQINHGKKYWFNHLTFQLKDLTFQIESVSGFEFPGIGLIVHGWLIGDGIAQFGAMYYADFVDKFSPWRKSMSL
jgi:hypothetical protein